LHKSGFCTLNLIHGLSQEISFSRHDTYHQTLAARLKLSLLNNKQWLFQQICYPMYFKVQLIVNDIISNKDAVIRYDLYKPYPIKIEIKNPPKEYLEKSSTKSLAFCDVFTEREPEDVLFEIFRKMDIENKPISTNSKETNDEQNSPIHLNLRQELVPDNYVDYLNQIGNDLKRVARQLIGLIRWTNNFLSPHDPIGFRGAYWSLDNTYWYHFPRHFQVFLTRKGHTLHLQTQGLGIISALYENNINEPVYHELFREAWSQRVENPRSAIAIGVAAVEVGTKILISKIVPNTKWLMEHLPMPPVYEMLNKYLPTLQSLNKARSNCIIPKSLKKTILKLIEIRNDLVHVGSFIENKKDIEDMLEDVKDILLLFDYYSGFEFSLSYLRNETIKQLDYIETGQL
jgi:hypothetical protein